MTKPCRCYTALVDSCMPLGEAAQHAHTCPCLYVVCWSLLGLVLSCSAGLFAAATAPLESLFRGPSEGLGALLIACFPTGVLSSLGVVQSGRQNPGPRV